MGKFKKLYLNKYKRNITRLKANQLFLPTMNQFICSTISLLKLTYKIKN